MPLGFLSGCQRAKQCMHCSVISLALSVSHRVVQGCSGFLDRVNLVQLGDNLGVKTPSLVRVYPTLNSITEEPLPYQSFGYSLCCVVPSRHCYSKFAVYVRHNQNIFHTVTGRLEYCKIDGDYFLGCVRVREVHEPHHASDDPSPLERIAAQLELLANTHSEIVSLLRAQQHTAAGVAAIPNRPEPRSSGSLHYEYCRRRGHTQNTCWKRASDIRRTDEQSGVHTYGDQSDTRAMRGAPVARSNVPVSPRG